jgi:hypothetical protein
MMRCFTVSKGHTNSFSATEHRKRDLDGLLSDRIKISLWWRRRIDVSWCRKKIRTRFRHSEHWKKRFEPSCLSDVLSWRMALRTHNLPCERIKKRLWWSRWSDVSWCRKDNWKHFSILGIQISVSKSMKSFLSRRMALKTHNLHSGRLKNDFSGRWLDFSRCQRPLELNFWVLRIEKSDFDEIA